ncbi:MAG TPA: transglutaminase-like domain-containing protein [Urbifossiella sp.]|jgi:transglutaminase-like putative cysteine protease|nr:transglutaminase-like domain-containing protein [Urbifossiella sp.]
MRLARFVAVTVALLVARPAAADPPLAVTPEQLDQTVGDAHYGIYLKGRRIGSRATAFAAAGAGPGRGYVLTDETTVRLPPGSPAAELRYSLRTEYDGQPPYALRVGTYTVTGLGAGRALSLERTASGYDAVVSQVGVVHRFRAEVTGHTLLDAIAIAFWLRGDPPPGAPLTTADVDWLELKSDTFTLKYLGRSPLARVGNQLTVQDIEVTNHRGRVCLTRYDPAAREVVEHVLPTGEEYRLEPPAPNRPLEEPPADEIPPEIMRVNRRLGAGPFPYLWVTFSGYTGTGLESGPGQSVTALGNGRWECRLGKGEGVSLPVAADDARAALAETVRYPFKHRAVAALARKAVGTARTPAEKVERLVRFVRGHIRYERSVTPELFELLQTRAGNCQSHALLFVCLARAEGIPAREVIGLVYAGDAAGGFAAHQWAEVARDGVWHPVDPTAGLTELDATYIRMEDWTAKTTLTVDEVPWNGGLRGMTPRAVARWLRDRPGLMLAWAGIGAVVVFRSVRMVRRGVHRKTEPPPSAEPDGGGTPAPEPDARPGQGVG